MPPSKNEKKDDVLRQPAEVEFADELAALAKVDKAEKPEGWLLSPKAVEAYVLGREYGGAKPSPKYVGQDRLVQIAIATLATDSRALARRRARHCQELAL